MANGILIVGPPGSGKSTAIETLDPKTTFIINSDKKPLPFSKWRTNYVTVTKPDGKVDYDKSNYVEINEPVVIYKVLEYISAKRPEIKEIVIDTLNHILTAEFMRTAKISGYQKFTDLALDVYNILKLIPTLRKDLIVYVMGHPEVSYDADGSKLTKLRTIGKMLDEKVNIESMFTVVLFTSVQLKNEAIPYGFETQTDGFNTGKSPKGMFSDRRIPNDFAKISETIRTFEN